MYYTMKDIELINDDVYDLKGEYSVLTYLSELYEKKLLFATETIFINPL